jgi:hypothetical protein
MTKKKDKILPIKVWLDEDSCWNTKPQGEGYTEYIRKDIVEKILRKIDYKYFISINNHGQSYFNYDRLIETFNDLLEDKKEYIQK